MLCNNPKSIYGGGGANGSSTGGLLLDEELQECRRKLCFLVVNQDVEDQTAFSPSPTKHRATLWETWGARQGWIKGIKAAATVATLSLGFLTLVETAYLFGIGKVCVLPFGGFSRG